MAKYQLSLSSNYVAGWGLTEAVREIFQNAIDQSKGDPKNAMSWNYHTEDMCLTIANKSSELDTRTLLLGESSKRGDDTQIGQFGEGYKLALLVLTRLGKTVTVYNYGKREVWTARLVNSRKFGVPILEVDVDRKHFWESVPDNNLTWVIAGIDPAELHEKIVPYNLLLQDLSKKVERVYTSDEGSVLDGEWHKGKIYVSGLFVAEVEGLSYGYDLPPNKLKLDRDRGLVDNFDLCWSLSKLWGQILKEAEYLRDMILDMIISEAPEVRYISNLFFGNELSVMAERYVDSQVAVEGENLVFISTGQAISPGQIAGRPVVSVPQQLKEIISKSGRADYLKLKEGRSILEVLLGFQQFYQETAYLLPKAKRQELAALILEQAKACGYTDFVLDRKK